MLAILMALAIAPWSHSLAFRPLTGWQTGTSGTHSGYVRGVVASSAWMARNVRYRDAAAADPPNKTLAHLRRTSVIVWAVISNTRDPNEQPISRDLAEAKRYACCEAVGLRAPEYELTGSGPHHAYSVIVRIYFGSKPGPTLRAQAQLALRHLALPAAG